MIQVKGAEESAQLHILQAVLIHDVHELFSHLLEEQLMHAAQLRRPIRAVVLSRDRPIPAAKRQDHQQ